ncbi:MAG: nucleoside hydrolase [Geminicoccaceae bacterium]
MTKHTLLMDCDPGQDDAIALMMALAMPEAIELCAVTTVAGNVPLDKTTANARRILDLLGRDDIRVHAGCARPILRTPMHAEHVHGVDGLVGVGLPPPSRAADDGHAVDVLIAEVDDRPAGTVTLAATGPLTNVALALIKAPEFGQRLQRIVLMGGSSGVGNVSPAAEFNIFADPHAAAVVFASGVEIVMLPLDATHQVIVTAERHQAVRALGGRLAEVAADLIDPTTWFERDRFVEPGAPLHDPCVIAWLLAPELFGGKEVHVAVETAPGPCFGATVCDLYAVSGQAANARLIDKVDAPGVFRLLLECLMRCQK